VVPSITQFRAGLATGSGSISVRTALAGFEIWRIPSQGGSAEQVTRDGAYVARESADSKTLYYTKTSVGPSPLFARPLGGGNEKQILERVLYRGFDVFEDGIYYLDGRGESKIWFHEFATGRGHMISPIKGQLFNYLSVSPDQKTILFTLGAESGSDLMLIENFH
jgi:hypothetical protein